MNTYLNYAILSFNEVKRIVEFVICGIFIPFFIFALITEILDLSGEGEISIVIVWLICLLLNILILWNAIKTGILIRAAVRYNDIFCADRDGTNTLKEFSIILNKPDYAIEKELKTLFRYRYFRNCVLQQGGDFCVILNDAKDKDVKKFGFVEVTCKNCGGTSRIRAGTVGKCSYCGSPLKEE